MLNRLDDRVDLAPTVGAGTVVYDVPQHRRFVAPRLLAALSAVAQLQTLTPRRQAHMLSGNDIQVGNDDVLVRSGHVRGMLPHHVPLRSCHERTGNCLPVYGGMGRKRAHMAAVCCARFSSS